MQREEVFYAFSFSEEVISTKCVAVHQREAVIVDDKGVVVEGYGLVFVQGLDGGMNGKAQDSRYCGFCGGGGFFRGSFGGSGSGVFNEGLAHRKWRVWAGWGFRDVCGGIIKYDYY